MVFRCFYILLVGSFISFLVCTDLPSSLEGVCGSDQAQSACRCLRRSVAVLFPFIY
jgi:hypothetical protein